MASEEPEGANMPDGARPSDPARAVTWPEWHPEHDPGGYRRLARYVSVQALWDLDLLEHEAHRWDGRPLALLERLYTRLRAKDVPYNKAPWTVRSHQRVRDPHLVDRSSGTCLDLSLMFAAMCESAGLRPYVTVLGDHALVLVHTEPRPTAERMNRPPVALPPGHGYERGVFRVYGGRLRLRGGTAVDVVRACRGGGDFAEACRAGATRLAGEHDDIRMVDVVRLHSDGDEDVRPLPMVRDDSRPAIYRRLPTRPPFVDFPGRHAFVRELTAAVSRGGTLVLYGPQGLGKSMLAHHLAARADQGCGWFLDAFDQRTLTASLGDAEIEERGLAGEARDSADRTGYAALALERLGAAKGPWVVVLDNVRAGPGELRLPQPAREGQLVVVTTTNRAWARPATHPGLRAANATALEVPPLGPDDSLRVLGVEDAPLDLLAGRPLLLEASARFRTVTGRTWWRRDAALPTGPEAVPAAIWAAAVHGAPDDASRGPLLGDPASAEHRLATAMAWLPPSGTTPALLELTLPGAASGEGEPPAPREGLERLHSLGLIDFTGGRAAMHRLFRKAIREDGLRRSRTETAALVGTVYRNLLATTDTARLPRTGAGPAAAASPFDLVLDTTEVRALTRLLAEELPDRDAFRSLHALGVLVERQDRATAADCFEQARLRAGPIDAAADAGRRVMFADCLRGKARDVHSTPGPSPRGTVEEAIEWVVRARALCEVPGAGHAELLAASRAEAMHGLLIRKQANTKGPAAHERLALLRRAERILRHSAAEREKLTGAGSPDVDRSRFNLAGLEISLAQADAGSPPGDHLDAAERHYGTVLSIRERRYHTRHLEEVITCVHGMALVGYYRAVLQPVPPAERARLLTDALRHAREALEVRQSLAITIERDVLKSLDILAKITLARLDAHQLARGAEEPPDASEKLYDTYRQESDGGRFTPPPDRPAAPGPPASSPPPPAPPPPDKD
ncbi:ATP-binding protein [Streptomyces ziwulingensis]|uniref:AAA+ ATPase domain-containing protein n=1 Tax=Streptomyces ziwulingensis TaxID=1045501 RepID=A0ABP9CQU0_9ACTN